MANPRQRSKAKSSKHRPVSHSQRAKTLLKKTPVIKGPKVLQDAWNKHRTSRQNYLALGITHTLNPVASGGVEKTTDSFAIQALNDLSPSQRESESAAAGSADLIPKGHGRIIRDSHGAVTGVEFAVDDDDAQLHVEIEAGIPVPEGNIEKSDLEKWGRINPDGAGAIPINKNAVVTTLETLSQDAPAAKRYASTAELLSLSKLVDKYGEDVEAMSKDRKLNPHQRTTGELSRSIRRAGGFKNLK